MADYYATSAEPSLSLPIRMEQKRKRTRAGAAAIVGGVVLLVGAVNSFTQSGSELIGIYLTVVAIGLLSLGVSLRMKANRIA